MKFGNIKNGKIRSCDIKGEATSSYMTGILLDNAECADILNMRITRGECSVRSGRRQLSGNVPGNNPILKTFTYKAPNNTEDLYAFTKDNIYKYVEGTDLWTYAYTFEMFGKSDLYMSSILKRAIIYPATFGCLIYSTPKSRLEAAPLLVTF